LIISALLSTSVYAAIEEGYAAPNTELGYGPIVRTGRYRVIQERVLGTNDYSSTHMDRPFLRREDETIPEEAQRFHYDRELDGRKVYIYRRVHTPVRYTNGVMERVGPATTVDRWAEGGYTGSQGQQVEVYSRVGDELYSDKVVPVKEGFANSESI
ncbi:hypothetical protein PFISCL1PPCAC_24244, partial [Pristionchus fissidentatus]